MSRLTPMGSRNACLLQQNASASFSHAQSTASSQHGVVGASAVLNVIAVCVSACVKKAIPHIGAPCEMTSETETCNGQACENDCELSEWSKWSWCSKDYKVKCGVKPKQCKKELDIVFLLDGSGSLGKTGWKAESRQQAWHARAMVR